MEDAVFHGDTMGVHIHLLWFVVPVAFLSIYTIYYMILQDWRAEEVEIPWNSKNNLALLFILGPLPLQWILLASGEPHGITDQIGVIISIIQAYAVPFILRPYKASIEVSGTVA